MDEKVKLAFTNQSGTTAMLCWLSNSEEPQVHTNLENGVTQVVESLPEQCWEARNSDGDRLLVHKCAGPANLVIPPHPLEQPPPAAEHGPGLSALPPPPSGGGFPPPFTPPPPPPPKRGGVLSRVVAPGLFYLMILAGIPFLFGTTALIAMGSDGIPYANQAGVMTYAGLLGGGMLAAMAVLACIGGGEGWFWAKALLLLLLSFPALLPLPILYGQQLWSIAVINNIPVLSDASVAGISVAAGRLSTKQGLAKAPYKFYRAYDGYLNASTFVAFAVVNRVASNSPVDQRSWFDTGSATRVGLGIAPARRSARISRRKSSGGGGKSSGGAKVSTGSKAPSPSSSGGSSRAPSPSRPASPTYYYSSGSSTGYKSYSSPGSSVGYGSMRSPRLTYMAVGATSYGYYRHGGYDDDNLYYDAPVYDAYYVYQYYFTRIDGSQPDAAAADGDPIPLAGPPAPAWALVRRVDVVQAQRTNATEPKDPPGQAPWFSVRPRTFPEVFSGRGFPVDSDDEVDHLRALERYDPLDLGASGYSLTLGSCMPLCPCASDSAADPSFDCSYCDGCELPWQALAKALATGQGLVNSTARLGNASGASEVVNISQAFSDSPPVASLFWLASPSNYSVQEEARMPPIIAATAVFYAVSGLLAAAGLLALALCPGTPAARKEETYAQPPAWALAPAPLPPPSAAAAWQPPPPPAAWQQPQPPSWGSPAGPPPYAAAAAAATAPPLPYVPAGYQPPPPPAAAAGPPPPPYAYPGGPPPPYAAAGGPPPPQFDAGHQLPPPPPPAPAAAASPPPYAYHGGPPPPYFAAGQPPPPHLGGGYPQYPPLY